MRYYKDITDYKGTIVIGGATNVRKTGRAQITLNCERKNKEYVLIQPDTSTINYEAEKFKGRCLDIDQWIEKIKEVIEGV